MASQTTPLTLTPPLPTKTLYQFPPPAWIENVTIRPNNTLLLTLLTAPEIHLLDPTDPSKTVLVHSFAKDGKFSCTGICSLPSSASVSKHEGGSDAIKKQTDQEIYYIAAGEYNTTTTWTNTSNSYSLYSLDLTTYSPKTNTGAIITHLTTLPQIGFPNGLTSLSTTPLLIADSEEGCIWKFDVRTNEVVKWFETEELKPPPKPAMQIGVNGIKIFENQLYFSSSVKMLFGRVPLVANKHSSEGEETGVERELVPDVGKIEVLEKGVFVDDFVLDGKGRAWLAGNVMNTLSVRVAAQRSGTEEKEEGKVTVVAAGLEVAGATACVIGKGETGKEVLYVVTTGGLANPVDGKVEGGKVFVVDIGGLEARLSGA